jgi:hypothetical protein
MSFGLEDLAANLRRPRATALGALAEQVPDYALQA